MESDIPIPHSTSHDSLQDLIRSLLSSNPQMETQAATAHGTTAEPEAFKPPVLVWFSRQLSPILLLCPPLARSVLTDLPCCIFFEHVNKTIVLSRAYNKITQYVFKAGQRYEILQSSNVVTGIRSRAA